MLDGSTTMTGGLITPYVTLNNSVAATTIGSISFDGTDLLVLMV